MVYRGFCGRLHLLSVLLLFVVLLSSCNLIHQEENGSDHKISVVSSTENSSCESETSNEYSVIYLTLETLDRSDNDDRSDHRTPTSIAITTKTVGQIMSLYLGPDELDAFLFQNPVHPEAQTDSVYTVTVPLALDPTNDYTIWCYYQQQHPVGYEAEYAFSNVVLMPGASICFPEADCEQLVLRVVMPDGGTRDYIGEMIYIT